MTDIEAPTLMELGQVCDFARTRLEQLDTGEYDVAEQDPPSKWEWDCLEKTVAWLDQLKNATKADRLALVVKMLVELEHTIDKPTLWNQGMEKCWTISTGHLTEESAKVAETMGWGAFGLVGFTKADYGWWVHVPKDLVRAKDTPDDVWNIIGLAHMMMCDWVCLDRDAAQTSLLAWHKW